MREIMFKAKRIDNGEWVEGNLINLDADSGYCYIVPAFKNASTLPINWLIAGRMILVDPENLCQFTGLCDKNGKKIWENDIVTCQTKYGGDIGKVVFHNGEFCVLWNSTYHYPRNGKCENYYDINTKNLVKGNVFDQPELLQEESDE